MKVWSVYYQNNGQYQWQKLWYLQHPMSFLSIVQRLLPSQRLLYRQGLQYFLQQHCMQIVVSEQQVSLEYNRDIITTEILMQQHYIVIGWFLNIFNSLQSTILIGYYFDLKYSEPSLNQTLNKFNRTLHKPNLYKVPI